MDDEILSKFYNFVHSRPKRVLWENKFMVVLVDEVVRLREKHEGFTYNKLPNKTLDLTRDNCG